MIAILFISIFSYVNIYFIYFETVVSTYKFILGAEDIIFLRN